MALPLYVLTMAAQNVPGVAVPAAAGSRVPWRQTLLLSGAGTVAGAGAGAHAVNLAAITAALPASAEADPDPERRWVAAATAGLAYLAPAPAAGSLTTLMAKAPPGVIESVAGLACWARWRTARSDGSVCDRDATSAEVNRFSAAEDGKSIDGRRPSSVSAPGSGQDRTDRTA